ncbi:MAG: hypothetical protein PHE58_07860 [Candidatus Omnitrophica bacterium]|nr:hypothetical protein [Candidatus Omnitrophota bacterium]
MMNKGKAYLLILVVMILLSLSFAGATFYLLQKEKATTSDLKKELDKVTGKLVKTNKRFEQAKKAVFSMDIKLKNSKTDIDKLKTDLTQAEAQKLEMNNLVNDMKMSLEKEKVAKVELEGKIAQAQDELKQLKANIDDISGQKTKLEEMVKDLRNQVSQVDLGKIVVNPAESEETPESKVSEKSKTASKKKGKAASSQESKQPVSGGMEGKILVINKDYSFAVINLGSKDGVKIGNTFAVYHKDAYVGDVKVEKIHDSMSAAGFMSEDLKGKVVEGDKAVLKK